MQRVKNKRRKPKQMLNMLVSASWKTAKATAPYINSAVTGLFKWVMTDHTGFNRFLLEIPSLGFWLSLQFILIRIIFTLVGIFLSGILVFVMIAFGIPYILFGYIP